MNILFVINTEGQLLSAASLIFERFNEPKGYKPYVLQVSSSKEASRFKNKIEKKMLTSNYLEIDTSDSELKEKLSEVLNTRFERIFIFLEQLALNVYLAYLFKRKGSIICLAPDGNKPYYKVTRTALPSRIQVTISTYKFLFSNKLNLFKPYLLSWNYARLKEVDEVWVTYPEKFENLTRKKVMSFTIMPNASVIQKMTELFSFKVSDKLRQTEGIIFYTNNILYKKEAYGIEIDAIKSIREKYPDKIFYIKYHPQTPDFQIEAFKQTGAGFFSNSIPAELYIASLKNSIIIGFWSTALMVNNASCKFYWLHNYLKAKGQMIDYIDLMNPTDYIQDVDDISKIVF